MSAMQFSASQSSPTLFNRAANFASVVSSNPLDATFGLIWLTYCIHSVSDVFHHVFEDNNHQAGLINLEERNISHIDLVSSSAFAVANVLKLVNWYGESPISGATKVACPKLSAAADAFYVVSYGGWMLDNAQSINAVNKLKSQAVFSKNATYQRSLELQKVSEFASNFSYFSFSAISISSFLVSGLQVGFAMGSAMLAYFVFLATWQIGADAEYSQQNLTKERAWYAPADSVEVRLAV